MTKKTTKKASKKVAKKTAKASKKKASKKVAKKTKDDHKKDNTVTRGGLVDVPDSRTGKNMRRILRAASIRLSERPDLGKVPVTISKDGLTASVKVDGNVYETATEKGRTAKASAK